MTCIVGYADGKRVWMGADSLVAFDDGQRVTKEQDKIIRRKNILIGLAGDCILYSLLKYKFKFSLKKNPTDRDVFNKVVIPFRNLLVSASVIKDDATMDGELLIGCNGKLYQVATDFDILELKLNDFHAIGSGSNYALGAMKAVHYTEENVKIGEVIITNIMKKGLEIAEHYQTGVRGPHTWEKV